MNHSQWKRWISMLLSLALLLSSCPVVPAAYANDGLCEHHTVHEGCGYVEPVAGVECGHVHDQDCYTVEAVCVHTHDEVCGYSEEAPEAGCSHVCAEETGCIDVLDGLLTLKGLSLIYDKNRELAGE